MFFALIEFLGVACGACAGAMVGVRAERRLYKRERDAERKRFFESAPHIMAVTMGPNGPMCDCPECQQDRARSAAGKLGEVTVSTREVS